VRKVTRGNLVNNGNYALGGGGNGLAAAGSALGQLFTNGTEVASFGEMTPIGAGVNYFLKSDKLNLSAIIQASKKDNRTKYIASPVVMTVDNKEATIDATENRQFLTGWTSVSGSYAGSSMPSPNYSAKDIGIKIKVTPKINPNGTVMLTVEEEYSRFVEGGQSMLQPSGATYTPVTVDLAVERKMSADVRLENMQTVVFGGLIETSKGESETGIPILKDIPWVGKWLFGSVSQSENRKELLVFMTPYVLDDEESAQLEALRRKKPLSDPNPWEDHGWSASPLADPVSKKEQMRRLKDEWKSQDEERKTKLAIEDEKVKRAKALEQMSKEERNHWLEMHKDELDGADRDEEAKELKEKMKSKDDETQEELRKLAADIRERKLKESEAKIKEADDAAQAENEYQKLQEAKKGEEPSGGQPQDAAGDEVKQ
jgi:type II secretory pathway component HofQ